jgi:hypothetical protein
MQTHRALQIGGRTVLPGNGEPSASEPTLGNVLWSGLGQPYNGNQS